MDDELGELLELARSTSFEEVDREVGEGTVHEYDASIIHDSSFPYQHICLYAYRRYGPFLGGEIMLKKAHEGLMLPETGPGE